MARTRTLSAVVSVIALASGLVALQSGSAAAAPTAKKPCTITGTSGDDLLIGTSGDHVICGRGGRDVIIGKGGKDELRGGRGGDSLYGDTVEGPDTDDDTLVGGPGDDNLELHGEPPACGWNCADANLQMVDMSGADMRGFDFTRANLQGANLSGAIMRNAKFTEANLKGADLSEANAMMALFALADLRGAITYRIQVAAADFYRANLCGTNRSDSWDYTTVEDGVPRVPPSLFMAKTDQGESGTLPC
jgi:hypothetical protein